LKELMTAADGVAGGQLFFIVLVITGNCSGDPRRPWRSRGGRWRRSSRRQLEEKLLFIDQARWPQQIFCWRRGQRRSGSELGACREWLQRSRPLTRRKAGDENESSGGQRGWSWRLRDLGDERGCRTRRIRHGGLGERRA
jgi:hypothetical protein